MVLTIDHGELNGIGIGQWSVLMKKQGISGEIMWYQLILCDSTGDNVSY